MNSKFIIYIYLINFESFESGVVHSTPSIPSVGGRGKSQERRSTRSILKYLARTSPRIGSCMTD